MDAASVKIIVCGNCTSPDSTQVRVGSSGDAGRPFDAVLATGELFAGKLSADNALRVPVVGGCGITSGLGNFRRWSIHGMTVLLNGLRNSQKK